MNKFEDKYTSLPCFSRISIPSTIPRVVQRNFTPEIEVFYMLFDTSLSIFTLASLKQHMTYFNFRCWIQLDLPVQERGGRNLNLILQFAQESQSKIWLTRPTTQLSCPRMSLSHYPCSINSAQLCTLMVGNATNVTMCRLGYVMGKWHAWTSERRHRSSQSALPWLSRAIKL